MRYWYWVILVLVLLRAFQNIGIGYCLGPFKILVMVLGISWKLGFIIHQEYHKIKGKKDKIMEVLVLILGSIGVF